MKKFKLPKDLGSMVQPEPVSIVPEMVKGRRCLIDGDFLAYFAAGGENMPVSICRQVVRERAEKFRVMTGSESILLQLSDNRCTKGDRVFISTTQPYQGQRLSGKKPGNWQSTREYIDSGAHGIPMKVWKTREADDGAAYCAETQSGGLDAICTKDKDWRMFAGLHCIWDTFQLVQVNPGDFRVDGPAPVKDKNGKTPLQKYYGHFFFWQQMLYGDTADHIPGIHGIGEATAAQLLLDCTCNFDAFNVVADIYAKKKRAAWADYMVEQAALLWMRTDRHADLLDFLKIFPEDEEIIIAAEKMKQRVIEDKRQLEEILNGYTPK